MGANRFLKLGGLELVSRGARTFFLSPPSSPSNVQAPPILGGLDIHCGGLKNIQAPLKLGGLGY